MKSHLKVIIKVVLNRKRGTVKANFIGRVESSIQGSGGRELNMVQACGSQGRGIPTSGNGKMGMFKDSEFTIQ